MVVVAAVCVCVVACVELCTPSLSPLLKKSTSCSFFLFSRLSLVFLLYCYSSRLCTLHHYSIATCWAGEGRATRKTRAHRKRIGPEKYLMHRRWIGHHAIVIGRSVASARRCRRSGGKGSIKDTGQGRTTILVMIVVAHHRGRWTRLIAFHHSVRHNLYPNK